MGSERRTDVAIAELAARQHGVVARRQLREIGLGSRAIDHRLACRRLHPLHRAVYAVGHRVVSRSGRWMAAVLASGADAVLSHRDAAALSGMRPSAGARRVEVTVPRALRPRPGIRVHYALLQPDEITAVDGIPVTTVPRTLLDLAAVLDRRQLERAVHECEVLRLWDALSLRDLADRYPRRRGMPAIRAVLADLDLGLKLTRNDLEAGFLGLVEDECLPRPEVNAALAITGRLIEVDFLWRAQRLAVELDGGAVHRTARLFESDRERDRLLQAAGWRVVRVTWRELEGDRRAIGADLRSLLFAQPRQAARAGGSRRSVATRSSSRASSARSMSISLVVASASQEGSVRPGCRAGGSARVTARRAAS